jgi:FkbM family methyltransferase
MFSQNLEEQYILEYFGDHVGTFLDLGCNDCQTFSNTRALALRGWKGVLIDPSPKAITRCKELYNGYKGYYIYEWAISDHNGKAILNESGPLCSAADVGLVSTFHAKEMDRFKRTVKYDPIEVKTFKWKTAFNRLYIKQFDMISMDCEGDELNILPDMDLTKTRLIVLEWNSHEHIKREYEKYLDGFKLIYTSGENVCYARV